MLWLLISLSIIISRYGRLYCAFPDTPWSGWYMGHSFLSICIRYLIMLLSLCKTSYLDYSNFPELRFVFQIFLFWYVNNNRLFVLVRFPSEINVHNRAPSSIFFYRKQFLRKFSGAYVKLIFKHPCIGNL